MATAPRKNGPTCSWTRLSTLCLQAGFRKILLRGDTKFAQTKHLDRWDATGMIRFIFGFEARDSLKARADELPADAYSFLERSPRYQIKTAPREKPERIKPEIVRERGYETIHLLEEMVASSTTSRSPARRAIA